jgi:hypothetical protein
MENQRLETGRQEPERPRALSVGAVSRSSAEFLDGSSSDKPLPGTHSPSKRSSIQGLLGRLPHSRSSSDGGIEQRGRDTGTSVF